jgi:hypothetical protein
MDSKNSEKTESKIRQMNIFPIYILAMLLRAWFFSGEGNTMLIHILCKAKSFQFNWYYPFSKKIQVLFQKPDTKLQFLIEVFFFVKT